MRTLFITCLLLLPLSVKPCGWSPSDDNYFYYNLFQQTNISEEGYYPFLYDQMNRFYDLHVQYDDPATQIDKGNVALWKKLLPDWELVAIDQALKTNDPAEFEKFWKGKKNQAAKSYMEFARACSQVGQSNSDRSWDYKVIRNQSQADIQELLTDGNQRYTKESNPQLKLRYAYQIIRLMRRDNQLLAATRFFETELTNIEKNELYYYILDQVAGCYYWSGKQEKAAYLFLQVFGNSLDRKTSAYNSYDYCLSKNAEGKSLLSSTADQEAYILMKSLRTFSAGSLKGLKQLYALSPSSNKVELLFMRALNDVERHLLPKHEGIHRNAFPASSEQYSGRLHALLSFSREVIQNKDVQHQEFWQMAEAYTLFLMGDAPAAKNLAAAIQPKQYAKELENLKTVFEVFTWENVGVEQEQFLVNHLKAAQHQEDESDSYNWQNVALEQVGAIYYQNDRHAQAFLIHNRLEDIERIPVVELMDDLNDFVTRTDKGPFEQLLMERAGGDDKKKEAVNYLNLVKGSYYLQQADHEKASKFLTQVDVASTKRFETSLNQSLSVLLFSNNITECFNCSAEDIMTDRAYKANIFSFIDQEFSREDLASHLIKLEEMRYDDKARTRDLANYLLGNFYFNTSGLGYFRGTLQGFESNCCNHYYFPYYSDNRKMAAKQIEAGEGFNLHNLNKTHENLPEFTQRAREYFEQIVENSTDKELKAQALYQLAKCELHDFYSSKSQVYYSNYQGTWTKTAGSYKKSFDQLNEGYKGTEFYQQLLRECSFFELYSTR